MSNTNPFDEIALQNKAILTGLEEIKSRLNKLESQDDSQELIPRLEKAKQLNVSLSTIRNWEIDGVIKPIRLGRKVYFRKGDIHPKQQVR